MVILIVPLLLVGLLAAVWIRFIWLAHKETLGSDIITALFIILGVVLSLLALIPIIFPGNLFVVSRIQRVNKLERADLKMGEDTAANFPYVVTPIQEAYDAAIQALHKASERRKSGKRGLLVLGEANTGKTRLVIEALNHVLPRWFVIKLSYRDEIEIPNKCNIVILIDDLQQYASVVSRGTDSEDLREQLNKVRQVSRRVVVVATCRTEDRNRVESEFRWLFDDLKVVELPRFRADPGDVEGSQVVEEFVRNNAMYVEDWDGTIGSLVLGLTKKQDQYFNDLSDQARIVLRAMKLLHEARINDHNERYILRACSDVFDETLLQPGTKAWRDAIDLLKKPQFVTVKVARESANISLTIRKDAYFDQVITDYLKSGPDNSYEFERDFTLLQNVLVDLNSASDLLNLGDAFYALEQNESARAAHERGESTLANTARSIEQFKRSRAVYKKALAAYDLVLKIDNNNVDALFGRGHTQGKLNNVEKELEDKIKAVEILVAQAKPIEQKMQDFSNVIRDLLLVDYIGSADVGTTFGLNNEALELYDKALEIDPQNAEVWTKKGRTLSNLGREQEAQEAFENALKINANFGDALFLSSISLSLLGRNEEALEAISKSITLDPGFASGWGIKGILLTKLGRYEEALETLDHALELNSNDARILQARGEVLLKLKH